MSIISTNLFDLNENDMNYLICKPHENLELIHYNKKLLDTENMDKYKYIRSIIVDKTDNKVVMISPFKSLPFEEFKQKYPDNILVEEFIEGTMINVFFANNKWQISTKTNIGGNTKFFSKKTFKELFYEAVDESCIQLNLLDESISYSFVLQHPENRIVCKFMTTRLYLVEAYRLDQTNIEILNVRELLKSPAFEYSRVHSPWVHSFHEYDDLEQINMYNKNCMGIIIRNYWNNDRTKLRSKEYEQIRLLRGNNPNLYYHFIELSRNNKVDKFLQHYSEYTSDFEKWKIMNDKFNTNLYKNYVRCYIKKEAKLGSFPNNYKTHMFHLHEYYKNVLKSEKKFITLENVNKYIDGIDIPLYIWSVKYDNKEKIRVIE
jgi:hypothetical protein